MSDPTPLSDLPKPRDAEAVEKTREGFERSKRKLEEAEAQTDPLTEAAKDAEDELHATRVRHIREEATEQDVTDAKEAAAEAREAYEDNLSQKEAIREARDTLKEDLGEALNAAGADLYEEWGQEGHRRSQRLVNAARAFADALDAVQELSDAASEAGVRKGPGYGAGIAGELVSIGRGRREARQTAGRIAAAEESFIEDPS